VGEDDKDHYHGILSENLDDFYQAKFEHGEVRPGWSFQIWALERVADIKPFGSKGCHTTLRP
jgi:hypothetical protein